MCMHTCIYMYVHMYVHVYYNAPIKVLLHLPPCGQCGGIRGDLTSLKGNFPYRGAKFSVKSPTFPLLQCGV